MLLDEEHLCWRSDVKFLKRRSVPVVCLPSRSGRVAHLQRALCLSQICMDRKEAAGHGGVGIYLEVFNKETYGHQITDKFS